MVGGIFDLERFKLQLGQTILWCSERVSVADDQNSLRTLLPGMINDVREYERMMQLVDVVVTIRSIMIDNANDYYRGKELPIPPLPTDLAGGRLLVFYPEWGTWDPAASAQTEYFNVLTMPAWDSWVYAGRETVSLRDNVQDIDYLICWIPSQLIERVDSATQVDPSECIQWLDESNIPFSFLDSLKKEGLLG